MKDTKNIKVIGGAAAVLVVLIVALAVILGRNSGGEVYRDISIFELNATATVTRDGTTLDAYEGMHLENGDDIQVADEGYLRLVLDGDKYATLEAGTEIRLNAAGDSANSKTEIVLVNGAVLNEIDNKLNAGSTYELSTPTSVMAVRGTVFRVAMTTEGEASHTELIVLDGQVAAAPVLADGSIGEELLVNPGEAASFDRPDAQTDPVCTQTEISYEDLPAETLERILDLYQNGRLDELSIPEEQLEQIYEQVSGTQPVANDAVEQPQEPPKTAETSTPSTSTPENTTAAPQPSVPAHPAVTTPSAQASNSSSDKSDRSVTSPENEDTSNDTKEDTGYNTEGDAKGDSDQKGDSNQKDESGSNGPGHHPNPTVYTVTFLDEDGNLFGIQSVVSGAQAQRPLLSPISGSDWCDAQGNVFDFTTAITADLTLYYR